MPEYGPDDPNFYILSPREHMRARPGMYIGGTDERALSALIGCILEFLIIEFQVNRLKTIEIELRERGEIAITDDSHGISVAHWDQKPKTHLEALLEAEKFARYMIEPDVYPYEHASGMHMVNLEVAPALSSHFTVKNWRDGLCWKKSYFEGLPTTALTNTPAEPSDRTGTEFVFTPDPTIFGDSEVSFAALIDTAQQLAALLPGLTIWVTDRRYNNRMHIRRFHYPDGLSGFLVDRLRNCTLHEALYLNEIHSVLSRENVRRSVRVQLALQVVEAGSPVVYSAVNWEETDEGGTHLSGAITGLVRYMRGYMQKHFADEPPFERHELLLQRVALAVSVEIAYPSFGGSMKRRLVDSEIFTVTERMVCDALVRLEDGETQRNALCDRIIAQRRRAAANEG